ncbi:MAG: hypothetical protein LAT77_01825 [Aliidiomarina sp.]|uniref:hypothetical protein n=1 Tax=Aliidiomarina sp. TaxID=1872439 RepID=UPI0025C1D025|nr:hypothetical protein [Aliidiomarina sp.]MCH8500629.1 hypothetical protein [Aliidiomarina sp.]
MRFILLFIGLVFLSGCAKNWYIGEWQVTDVEFPAVSAMSSDEAIEWFGSEANYFESHFSFRDNGCESPRFEPETLTESEFYIAYRTSFSQLNIDRKSVGVLQVICLDNSVYPGSTLIKVADDIVYTPWDGAFFRLEKIAP